MSKKKKLPYTVREAWSGEGKGSVVGKFRYLPDARLTMAGLNKYVWPSIEVPDQPFTLWHKGKRVKNE